MATSKTPAAASTGGCLTRSCSVSSTNLSSRPAPACTGAGCTRRCSTGKRPTRRSSHGGLFQEFTGIWQAAEKIVFSTTLASVSSARTRVEPAFEPGLVRQLKPAAEHDMRVGGADLAGQAIKAGLADELRLFLVMSVMQTTSGIDTIQVYLILSV